MSLYDFLSLSPAPTPGVFSTVRNTQEARMIFEQLQRQEAIVMLPDKAVKITTPTLPVKIDQKKLAEIEHEYAKRLLTPLSQIEREVAGSNLLVVSSAPKSSSLATRRIASVPLVESKPLQIVTGSLSDDLLNALFHLHYATLSQLCKFLGRETSINHVRNKLNNLKADGMVDSTTLPVTAGKPPTIWFLTPSTRKDKADSLGLPIPLATGEKKHGYLEHTLACNEVLISSIPLPQVKPQFTLMNLKHERTLKNSAIKISEGVYLVPDGWVHLRLNNVEDIGFCFEIDRNTEEKEKIIAKLNNYVMFASGIYQKTFGLSSLSIAFCVTEGGDRRVKQLVSWAEQTLAGNKDAAALFLFGSVPPGSLEPESFFLDATFLTPFDIPPHALVDIL